MVLVLPGLLGACSGHPPAAALAGASGLARSGEALPPALEIAGWTILGPGVAGAGQPAAADFTALAARGYRTVVNLRAPGEPFPAGEAELAAAAGLAYHWLPVTPASLGLEDAAALAAILEQAPPGSVLVHCATGNRVGALWGLYLGLSDGLPPQAAVAAAERAGMRSPVLAERVADALERAAGR